MAKKGNIPWNKKLKGKEYTKHYLNGIGSKKGKLKKKKIHSERDLSEIIELYNKELKNPREIGKLYNCCATTILKLLRTNGIDTSLSHRRMILMKNNKIGSFFNTEEYKKHMKETGGHNKGKTKENYEPLKRSGEKIRIINKGKHHSPETEFKRLDLDEKEIIHLYNEGLSCNSIKKKFGCSNSKISNVLKENGVKVYSIKSRAKEIRNPIIINKFKDLYYSKDNPYRLDEISEILNLSLSAIRGIIKENNLSRERIFSKGKYNPRWVHGNSTGTYGEGFTLKLKKSIRERDGCCMLCNISLEDLKLLNRKIAVHHLNYDKDCNTKENLILLCNNCHSKTNGNREEWKKFFQSILSKRYGYNYSEDGKIIINLNEVKE